MKRIIICCDGTWNTPDEKEHGMSCATNVSKLAEMIAPVGAGGTPQITYYHDGVGTGDLGDKIIGGAFGSGISKNILDCYRFLVSNYVTGDEIWLFGFSRGAYTARSIIGLIRNSGLLKKPNLEKLPDAYQIYRDRTDKTHPDANKAQQFRNDNCYPDAGVAIKFLGVWDTVGSLGVPDFILHSLLDEKWEFHDVQLSSIVANAYHAVAIDEKRKDFEPCLWDAVNGTISEQVWFPGVHSDVGGGYPEAGLSDCALAWMLCKAESNGLALDRNNVWMKPDAQGKLHDSMRGAFILRGQHIRNINGPVSKSAMERHTAGGYQPVNWPSAPLPVPEPCIAVCTQNIATRC
jgi:uncharacterized protein (DUF2235 family)